MNRAAHPDIQASYSACGPPVIGALAIVAGDETGSVAQYPAKIGSPGIDAAYTAAQGQDVPANVDTGTEMLTMDNASQFQ